MAHSLARQNLPVPVVWSGFESDTYRLGRAGWQVAIEEEQMRMELRLMMHHPNFGLTAYGIMRDSFALRDMSIGRFASVDRLPPFVIQMVRAKDHRVVMHEPLNLADFRRVETVPTVTSWEGRMEDFPLFAELFAPIPEAQELIVDPQDVQAMLDQILKVQAPMRKEIRERDRRRDGREAEMRQVHAQIITLKAA
jgi:hypothetical protein